MLFTSMLFPMPMMIIFHEEVLVRAVHRESYCSSAQAWESALEPIVPREWTRVPPLFSVEPYISKILRKPVDEVPYARAHGSLAGMPADCANLRGSKPVTLGRGGGGIVLEVYWVSEGQKGMFHLNVTYTDPSSAARLCKNCSQAQWIEGE